MEVFHVTEIVGHSMRNGEQRRDHGTWLSLHDAKLYVQVQPGNKDSEWGTEPETGDETFGRFRIKAIGVIEHLDEKMYDDLLRKRALQILADMSYGDKEVLRKAGLLSNPQPAPDSA